MWRILISEIGGIGIKQFFDKASKRNLISIKKNLTSIKKKFERFSFITTTISISITITITISIFWPSNLFLMLV